MRPEYYLPKGILKKFYERADHESKGLFSLSKLLKKLFTRFKIAWVDDCCPIAAEDQTDLPVRYNMVEEQLEFYNPNTSAWEAVA